MGGSSNVAFQWEIPVDGTYEAWGFEGLDSDTYRTYVTKAEGVVQPQQPPVELQHTYQQEFLDAYAVAGFEVRDTAAPPGAAGTTAYTNVIVADDKGRGPRHGQGTCDPPSRMNAKTMWKLSKGPLSRSFSSKEIKE